MDIQRNGRLAVNGGNPDFSCIYNLGGGAGGIIQIISPEGSLAAKTSLLRHGSSIWCRSIAGSGYMYLPGNVQQ